MAHFQFFEPGNDQQGGWIWIWIHWQEHLAWKWAETTNVLCTLLPV